VTFFSRNDLNARLGLVRKKEKGLPTPPPQKQVFAFFFADPTYNRAQRRISLVAAAAELHGCDPCTYWLLHLLLASWRRAISDRSITTIMEPEYENGVADAADDDVGPEHSSEASGADHNEQYKQQHELPAWHYDVSSIGRSVV